MMLSRDGFELVSFFGKKCHGEDRSDLAIDKFKWEHPVKRTTLSGVETGLEEWQKLYMRSW